MHGQQNFKYIVNRVTELYTKKLLLLYLPLHAWLQDAGDSWSETNMVTKIGVVLRTQQHVL